MLQCKDKLNLQIAETFPSLPNGNTFEEEFEIGVIEAVNLKYMEIVQSTPQQLQKLQSLMTLLKNHESLSISNILTHLDESVLVGFQIIDQKNYTQKRRKAITQMLYEQQKFNLLREENEGFSKLIVELNQANISMSNIDNVSSNVKTLIGFFSLDPNRVLDIILDSFINLIWNQEPYIELLRGYKGSSIA